MELAQHPPISDWIGKIELIDGEIVRMSPAHVPHWNAQRLAIMALQAAFAPNGTEWNIGGEVPVRLGRLTVRIPDVAVFRAPDMTQSIFDKSALFMAMEIADTGLRNDLGRKMRAYAAAGVPHYWVVDLKSRELHVMTDPADADYASRRVVSMDEAVPLPGIGSTVRLA